MGKKNIIIFRTDVIGDFVMSTALIQNVKNKFPDADITIVCSNKNYKIVKLYNIFNKIIIFDKKFNFFKKILLYTNILCRSYHICICLDGKNFSITNSILMKSKYKFLLVYKKQKKIFGHKFIFTRPFKFFIPLFTDCQYFSSNKPDASINHFPTLYSNLLKKVDVSFSNKHKYYFPENQEITNFFSDYFDKFINDKYLLIHLDEKWLDIPEVNIKLTSQISNLQKNLNYSLILTSYNNKFDYFNNLKKNFTTINFVNDKINFNNYKNHNKIIILENMSLSLLEKFISKSILAVSCHSGYMIHICGTNFTHYVDIINKHVSDWADCWVPKNTKYSRIYKTDLPKIFKNIEHLAKNKVIN